MAKSHGAQHRRHCIAARGDGKAVAPPYVVAKFQFQQCSLWGFPGHRVVAVQPARLHHFHSARDGICRNRLLRRKAALEDPFHVALCGHLLVVAKPEIINITKQSHRTAGVEEDHVLALLEEALAAKID